MAGEGLNDRQKRFCELYAASLNATSSYIEAGYKVKNEKVAGVNAARMLGNASIQAYLTEIKAKAQENTGITVDRVLEEYAKIAFSDISEAIEVDGTNAYLKPFDKLPKRVTASISSITFSTMEGKHGTSSKMSIRLWDKGKALEGLAKHLGISSDLNAAKATFQTYGYKLVQTDRGYELIDTYSEDASEGESDEGEAVDEE